MFWLKLQNKLALHIVLVIWAALRKYHSSEGSKIQNQGTLIEGSLVTANSYVGKGKGLLSHLIYKDTKSKHKGSTLMT
jgi:hypothetical protein